MKEEKKAWVTSVVDERTALDAIVLAKSLSRVVTVAETVVIALQEIPVSIMKTLALYFDVIILKNVFASNDKVLPSEDQLILDAWNLGMYSKCVILHSNTMVLRNCDELFDTNGDISYGSLHSNLKGFEVSAIVIKPCLDTYLKLCKLTSNGHIFKNFAELLTKVCKSRKFSKRKLCTINNFNVSPENQGNLLGVKMVSFGKEEWQKAVEKNLCENDAILKTIFSIWDTLYMDIPSNIKCDLLLSPNPTELKEEMYSLEKKYLKDAIAIVGYSCRFPGSNDSNEFWELIKNGGDGICQVPPDRLFDHQKHDPRFTETKAGFLKCAVDEFDAKFFGISPREASFMDPQQRLLVEVAWEALEDAAIDPHSLKGSNTGVFTGVWTHDYERLISENTTGQDFHHVVLGNSFSATSSRVSYFLGLNGPNVATESGCSSSMVALHLACESLKRGETDLGLVLGANVIILQFPLSEISILAPDGHCKTYDEKADGFGRAEGIAVMVLKRLPEALKSGDRILGLIRGSALSNEGTTSSFGTPSKRCQEIAIKEALRNSGVEPKDVDYVEGHGTGTPVGDPIEFAALTAGYQGEREEPLVVGSVKTNIGHTESAAGLAGVIKVLLAMKNSEIPPHLNFQNLNPNIYLDSKLCHIPTSSLKWKSKAHRVRIAGVSSFGISGTNVHAIIEEPPIHLLNNDLLANPLNEDRSHYILSLSAKSENALSQLASKYTAFLDENPYADIGDITFTANNGRAHFKHRFSVVAENISQLKSKLNEFEYITPKIKPGNGKIGFLFTGQGSQYLEMASELYNSNSVFRSAFQDCAKRFEKNVSLMDVLWNDKQGYLLGQTVYSQLTIYSIEYALLKLFESLGIVPDFVLGHSVGEFAAATAAGILDMEDALLLLAERSRLIESLPHGGMLAIRTSKNRVKALISGFLLNNMDSWLDIAVINSKDEVVVAGDQRTLELFQQYCSENNEKCQRLVASRPFHSRAMDSIIDSYGSFAERIKYNPPRCKYISGMTGKCITDGQINANYWKNHARETVQFSKAIVSLVDLGCNIFIEIGPQPILLALGMSNFPNLENTLWLPSIRKTENNWKTLLSSLGTLFMNHINVNWGSLEEGPRTKLQLPYYPFERQKYWIKVMGEEYVKPIHPLLGRRVSLADTKDTIYQHTWNLKDIDYLVDHQVANTIIVPAAGYLEVFLAAGRDCLLKGSKYSEGLLKVEDFVVESPLELEENKKYKIQVVVSPVENTVEKNFARFYVYQKINGYNEERGWKQYSSAYLAIQKEDKEDFSREVIKTIKYRCPATKSCKEMYQNAPEIGIFFGENFQKISEIWEGTNEILAKITAPSKAENDYIYHPVILDAMIQTLGLTIGRENAELYLPVSICRFSMCLNSFKDSSFESGFYFAHTKWEPGATSGTVALYTEKNNLLAVMENIRLIKTSVSNFLNVINTQKKLPGMYHEIWRVRDGFSQSRMDLDQDLDLDAVKQTLDNVMKETMKNVDPKIMEIGDEIVSLSLMEMFIKNGVFSEIGKIYNFRSVMQQHLVSNSHSLFFQRILQILSEDGYFIPIQNEYGTSDDWEMIKPFPNLEIIQRNLSTLKDAISTRAQGKHVITEIALKCKTKLWNVLQGKDAVEALFDSDDLQPLDIYNFSAEDSVSNTRIAKFLEIALKELKPSGQIVRILEIGGGSASTSREIIKILQKNGIHFRYTFTDISLHFISLAKEEFMNNSAVEYKVLDIEKDPSCQGFCPNQFDIVVAANVIHATKNLRSSIRNVHSLLMPKGIFIMKEMLKPVRCIDFIFGILDSYWKFSDFELRNNHPMASKQIWDIVFLENNLTCPTEITDPQEIFGVLVSRAIENNKALPPAIVQGKEKTWIVFSEFGSQYLHLHSKISNCGENVLQIKDFKQKTDSTTDGAVYICIEDYEQLERVLDLVYEKYSVSGIIIYFSTILSTSPENGPDRMYIQMLNICKYLSMNTVVKTRMYVVGRGVYYISNNQSKVNPEIAPLFAMVKSLKSEMSLLDAKLIDLDPDDSDLLNESNDIFFELFEEGEAIIAYRSKKRYVNRFVRLPKQEAPLTLPPDRYAIDIPNSKNIRDVMFRPAHKECINDNDVEILVKSFALNFRDVFTILKPDMYSTLFNAVGTDFSGIVTQTGKRVTKYKVGDEVFGISQTSSAASHVVVNSGMVLRKPKEFTFADASTIPSVFLTAYHCLVSVANLKKGETILIHVASGGVGLIAIQIAKHIGANIIATAGSQRKRNYLAQLGIKHIFHSRKLTFGDAIENLGLDIHVVLNSLTGHGFKETTLRICCQGARFVEIGKVNIWKNEDVEKLRPDVHYTIVDLEKVNQSEMLKLMIAMQDLFDKKVCTPLPYSRFEMECIRDALNYFLKAQHIGKIVVAAPEVRNKGGCNFINDLVFNSNATYLITGGLGGIGLEVAKWMSDCGAKNIVLAGRTAPNENVRQVLNKMKAQGCRLLSFQADVGNWEQCKTLFENIASNTQLPPLRGVVHSAGILSDAMYRNQTWEKFRTVFNAKVHGGWNLHNLTKDLNLEHFILFSSMAAIIGPMGQANHAAANMFLDSLAYYRHSIGLPAQTINWGAWSEIGAATGSSYGKEGLYGVKPFTPNQGIASLKFAMTRPNLVQLAVIQLNIAEYIQHFPIKDNILSELLHENEDSPNQSMSTQSKGFWDEISNLTLEQRLVNIKSRLETIIRRILRLPESEKLDEFQIFSDMGLDSLMAVEMRNKLQHIIGKTVDLNANSMLDHPNINSLSQYLTEMTVSVNSTSSEELDSKKLQSIDLDAIKDLIKKDSVLPEDIQNVGEAPRCSSVKNILLTGSTGRLGAYVLRDLLQTNNISQIYCLIRSKNIQFARKRLLSNLRKFHLQNAVDMISRVQILVGNITEERLGMSTAEYSALSQTIDCVYHMAAKTNHVEPYKQCKSNVDIRSVNVLGTLNVLRFASNIKTKRVIFASTYATINRLTGDGYASEEFPHKENLGDGISMGYVISKFVCEKLIAGAIERGLPCTVIRYPTLIGDSQTGVFTVETDTFLNLFFLSTRLGIVPQFNGGWNCLPCDISSQLTLEIGFSDLSHQKLFNLFQPVPIYSEDLLTIGIREGYSVKLVSEKDFAEKLQRECENNVWLSFLTADNSDFMSMIYNASLINELSLKSKTSLYRLSDNLRKVIPNISDRIPSITDIIQVYVDFANRSGIIEALGIHPTNSDKKT